MHGRSSSCYSKTLKWLIVDNEMLSEKCKDDLKNGFIYTCVKGQDGMGPN